MSLMPFVVMTLFREKSSQKARRLFENPIKIIIPLKMLRAKRRAFEIVLCSEQTRHFFGQHLRQLGMALAGQVHEVHLIELAVLCVQEVHALPLADDAELPGMNMILR